MTSPPAPRAVGLAHADCPVQKRFVAQNVHSTSHRSLRAGSQASLALLQACGSPPGITSRSWSPPGTSTGQRCRQASGRLRELISEEHRKDSPQQTCNYRGRSELQGTDLCRDLLSDDIIIPPSYLERVQLWVHRALDVV
ncbi:hypothetical protein NDU88_011500 [Pleurodeles waltl]|uniref:Uncharacterized protein n=1 Tax=Pleurodeles waltl TaxID=8319 RepID=A0AAV7QZA7_PLEWA|nr:hypothetical protein NDU88_011500 [Pleurodeles waltl]